MRDRKDKPLRNLRALAVSPVGGYGGFNTSVHRIKALESLGCEVHVLDSAPTERSNRGYLRKRVQGRLFRYGLPVPLPDLSRDNDRLLAAGRQERWDVIWLEKALSIRPETLRHVRKLCPAAKVVGFSPDDMNERHNQSQQFLEALPLYDGFVTTKSYNVAELRQLGCPKAIFVSNGFDPEAFRPLPVSPEDRLSLGGAVGFIGTYERNRAEMILYLASNGVRVRVWGCQWEKMRSSHRNLTIENKAVYGDDFCKACTAFSINLNFLRKMNRDRQTTRSVEIPACRGFMLAERTGEHLELFKEGEEAEFFASRSELLDKCNHYLKNESARSRIAQRGYERCLNSRYSNADRLREAFRVILDEKSYTSDVVFSSKAIRKRSVV